MVNRAGYIGALAFLACMATVAAPGLPRAEGIALLGDFEYFYTKENTTFKETGIVTDTEVSRLTQLYQLDVGRFVYPNLFVNLGGYFEQTDSEVTVDSPPEPQLSSDNTDKTIRPYMEVNLRNPLYRAGLAYRTRDTKSSGSLRADESMTVDEYDAVLNWRPVDLPMLNLHYQRIEAVDDPLTFDTINETYSLASKYAYGDFAFHYLYNGFDTANNLDGTGSLTQNHNGGIAFNRGFDYRDNRFDVRASAKYIYNTVEFTGAGAAVDTPADTSGSPFFILNDVPPTSNEPFELTRVDGSHPLTSVNIGINGGFNPVSAGLTFDVSTTVDTVYIQLSSDLDAFPNLASPSQVAAAASSFSWQFYSSDDPVELNWTEQPIASATYNSINNRFEIRLAASVSARQIKVTTVPLTLVAPGEIRYAGIRPLTTVEAASRGLEPENLDQYYTFSLQWTPSSATVMGYEGNYRNQEDRSLQTERTTLTNSLYFRHVLNQLFTTHGRVGRSDRTDTEEEDNDDDVEHTYALSLRANYLDTLSQTLTYSGASRNENDGSSTINSVILRTIADLYTGWSMNLDLGYSFNTFSDGVDQDSRSIRVGTIVEPNRRINISLDYSIVWTEETDRPESRSEYGTAQLLWSLTDTLNAFFRYNFRSQQGRGSTSTSLREFNINWAPFPDGAVQFSIGYNEETDFADQEIRTISPTLTWRVARGVFLDVRYSTGTIDSPTESTDLDSIIARLRLTY
jgi:hypothetical protein